MAGYVTDIERGTVANDGPRPGRAPRLRVLQYCVATMEATPAKQAIHATHTVAAMSSGDGAALPPCAASSRTRHVPQATAHPAATSSRAPSARISA